MTSTRLVPCARRPLLLLAVAALVVTGCSDDEDEPEATGTDATATTEAEGDAEADAEETPGTVVAEGFELTSTTAPAGGEVTFENRDSAAHTMTADDGAFDSGNVAAGSSATVTAPAEPGEYGFHCEIHPSMTGTLTVEG